MNLTETLQRKSRENFRYKIVGLLFVNDDDSLRTSWVCPQSSTLIIRLAKKPPWTRRINSYLIDPDHIFEYFITELSEGELTDAHYNNWISVSVTLSYVTGSQIALDQTHVTDNMKIWSEYDPCSGLRSIIVYIRLSYFPNDQKISWPYLSWGQT